MLLVLRQTDPFSVYSYFNSIVHNALYFYNAGRILHPICIAVNTNNLSSTSVYDIISELISDLVQ